MAETKQTRIPTPLYAAAGAGDLAYQQLRKLPDTVAWLRGRAVELRPTVTGAVADLTARTELDRLRETARRNAAAFMTSAQVAQERAVTVYGELVDRGERVVRGARDEAAADLRSAADAVVDAAAEIESAADTVAAAPTQPAATTDVATGDATVAEPATKTVRRTPRKRTTPAAE